MGSRSLLHRAMAGSAIALAMLAATLALVLVPGTPGVPRAAAAAVASTQDGNWNATATWGGNPVPGAADDVTITTGTTVTVNANATISSLTIQPGGTLSVGGFSLTVTGATLVDGTLSITSATGTKTFGAVTISATGSFTNTTEAVTIGGSLLNNGTLTSGTGVYTFSGTGATISGSTANAFAALTVSGTVTNTGTLSASGTVTVSGTLTNDGSFTITSTAAVGGAGTLVNAAARTFTLASSSITPTLDASAAGNTVEWNRAGTQTVKATTYHHLHIGGASGTKTISAAVTVNGNLQVTGGLLSVTTTSLLVSGTTTLNGGGLTSSGAADPNVKTFAGAVTVTSGTFTVSATTGLNEFTAGVTVEPGGTWTHSGAAPVTVTTFVHRGTGTLSSGPVTISGNLNIEAGLLTVSTAALTVSGSTTLSGGNLTSSGAAGAKTKTFTGPVTVQSGQTWTTSATSGTNQFDATVTIEAGGTWTQTGAAPVLFNGNVVNAGSFSATTGTVTLGGTGTSLTGAATYGFSSLTVTGTVTSASTANVAATLTVNGTLTNTSTFTASSTTGVAGAGTFVNGANAQLTLGSGSFAPAMSAAASGNTVTWNRTGSTQTVAGGAYFNLVIATSGTKTTGGATTVAGSVTVQDTATFSVTQDLAVTGNVQVTGGTFTVTTPTVTVGGGVTIASGASWTHTGAGSVTITQGVTTSGTYSITGGSESIGGNLAVNGGTTTFGAVAVTVSGTTTLSGGNLTSSSAAGANTKTFTGTVTIASGSTLLISATSGLNEFGDIEVQAGGTWSMTSTAAVAIAGNVSHAGTFSGTAGTITLTGTGKSLSGAGTYTLAGLTVDGTVTSTATVTLTAALTVNGSLTNNSTLSSSSTLAVNGTVTNNSTFTLSGAGAVTGAGTFVNGAGASLNLSSTSFAPVMSAAASGSTVSWNRTNTQTVGGGAYFNLVISGSGTKTTGGAATVAGSLTVQDTAVFSVTMDLAVTGDVQVTGGTLTITTPTVTVGGGVTIASGASWTHTGAASVTITQGVTTSGTYTVSLGSESIGGNLAINGGTTTFSVAAVTVGGTTTLTGGNLTSSGAAGVNTKTFTGTVTITNGRTLLISASSGLNQFLGDIEVQAGGAWSMTDSATVAIGGNVTNAGTFSATDGTVTFTGPGKTLSGNAVSLFAVNVTGSLTTSAAFTGTNAITVDGTLTNGATMSLTSTSALGGTGTIVNNAGATLHLASASVSPTLVASALGNTVDWNRNSTQTVAAATYHHLTISTSGTKTTGGAITANGDLTVQGTAAFSVTADLTVTGNLAILGGSLTVSTPALTIGGTTTLNGGNLTSSGAAAPNVKTFTGAVTVTSGTFAISATTGTNAFGAGVSVGAAGTWTHSGAAPVTIAQGVTTAGTFSATSGDVGITGNLDVTGGTATLGAAAVTIGGTTSLSGGNLTSSGTAGAKTKTFGGVVTVSTGRTFTITATSGVNAFLGNVVVDAGGTWTQTGAAPLTLAGDLQNNGTFGSIAGLMTFTGAGKSITGNAISIDDLSVSGTLTVSTPLTAIGAITVDGTLTAAADMTFTGTGTVAGAGTLVNGTGVTLALASAAMTAALDATAAGNTVSWNRSSTQTVRAGTYHHLVIANTGTKTAGGPLVVEGNLTVVDSAVFAQGAYSHTLRGNLVVDSVAASPVTTTTNSAITFAAPATPGATSISGTTGSSLSFRTVNFENPGGVTVHLGVTHTNNPMTVASGVTLTLAANVQISTSSTVTVSSGATFAPAATALVSGSGTFTLQSGATMRITSPDGIAASGASGHVQTGTRSFDGGATYRYEGVAAQATGTALPATTSTLTIDNAAGVTLSSDVAVTGALTLTSGTFSLGSATLTIAGTVTATGGGLAGGTSAGLAVTGVGANYTVPALTLGTFTVNRSAGVTLGGNVTVHGTMTLTDGLVTTSTHTLTIAATGNAVRTGGHVVGTLTRQIAAGPGSFSFPIGDATRYAPVTLDFADVTTPGSVSATTAAGDHASIGTSLLIANHSVNRTWTLTPTGLVFTTASGTFGFTAGDLDPTTDTTALVVSRFDGTDWSLPVVGTRTATSTQATGLTALGAFQVALRLQALTATTPAPASATFNSTFPVAGVSTSGLVVAITTSGGCSGAGAGSATITMTSGTTSCTVHFNQPGDSVYPAATELTNTTTAQKAAQTITVATPAPASATYASTFTVTASASSSLAVAVTTSGACTGGGSNSVPVTMTASTASCGVQYAQAGDANYLAAAPVNSSTNATPKPLTVNGITVTARAFNGTTGATLNVTGAALVGVVTGDTVTLDTSAAVGEFDSAGPGDAIPVTVTGLTIGGPSAALYSLIQPTLLGSIFTEAPPADDPGDPVPGDPLPPLGNPLDDGLGSTVPALPGTQGAVATGSEAPTVVTAPAVVQTDGGVRLGQVAVTLPPGAAPGATSLTVRSVASIGTLLAQAPPPADGRIIAAVSAVVLDASGRTLTGQFQEPAQVQVVIPATSTEASGALSDYVIVFWTGSAWTELPTRVVREADGAIRLTAEAQHFTLFAVKRRVAAATGDGAFAATPVFGPGGQAFAVFTRGSVAGLEARAAAAGASGVWVQDPSGRFRLLIISGPAFLGAEFRAAFPAGFGSATAVTLVRPA